jgi:high-affinity Fe2+/Pb2+ permease
MKYEPKIGKDFPINKELVVAKTRHVTELTRSAIALIFVSVAVLTLIVVGIYGLSTGDFHNLQTLWAVLAAPMFLVVGYYFRGTADNGKNDEGPA